MPLPAWPGSVPHAMLVDDFQVQQSHTPPLRSEMQAGNVRMRPQYTVRVTSLRASILLTNAELEAFKTFLFTTIADGSSKFTMPIWINGSYVTKTCYLTDGTASWSRAGHHWKLALNLSVEGF